MSPVLIQFLAFGILGWTAEILYTGAKKSILERDFKLMGHSSWWMFPVYGLAAFLYPILETYILNWPWWLRGLAYLLTIWSVEYVSAEIFKFVLRKPLWHYTGRYSLHGNIKLVHAPSFFALGLFIEWLHPRIVALSELGLF